MKRWLARHTGFDPTRAVRLACFVGLVALLLMAWSVLAPSPLAVVVGMSLGHGLGVLAAGLFGLAIFFDFRRTRRKARQEAARQAASARDALP